MLMNSMEGVDESLYDSPQSEDKPDSVDQKNQEDATDLMSKSSFPGGCKVGDHYQVEITGDHGDQFSVKVTPEDKEEQTEPDQDDELDRINKDY